VNKSFVTVFCSLMCCHNTPLHFFYNSTGYGTYPSMVCGQFTRPSFCHMTQGHQSEEMGTLQVTMALSLGEEDYICIA